MGRKNRVFQEWSIEFSHRGVKPQRTQSSQRKEKIVSILQLRAGLVCVFFIVLDILSFSALAKYSGGTGITNGRADKMISIEKCYTYANSLATGIL